MKAGFSQICISEGVDFTMGGMFMQYKPESVHTPLYASAWAMDAGGVRTVWVSADIILFEEQAARKIQAAVSERTGVPPDNVLVSATHTHTGPNTGNISVFHPVAEQHYLQTIYERVVEACVAAFNKMEPARMGFNKTPAEGGSFNRRYIMKDGKSEMHPGGPENPNRIAKEGPDDNLLSVVWFENDNGLLGVVVNISGHPSGMYGVRVVSGDYPGVMRRTVQQVYGGIPVLFLLGFSGNTSMIDHERDATWSRGIDGAERVGKILGGHVIRLVAGTRLKDVPGLKTGFATGRAEVKYRVLDAEAIVTAERTIEKFNAPNPENLMNNGIGIPELAYANKIMLLKTKLQHGDGEYFNLTALRVGNVLFLTCPAEYFVEFQISLKKHFTGFDVVCVSVTNGWYNYIPTRQAYLLGGYEVNQGLYDWRAGYEIERVLKELGESVTA